MMYDLPTSLEVGGAEYAIRSDYRAALDICAALSDPSMSNQEKAVALLLLYEDYDSIPAEDVEDALRQAVWFLDCGDGITSSKPRPKLMDWERDFKWIVAPINRVAGTEVRSVQYMHWWTFVSCYYEIGDCIFAQFVGIRNKLEKHKRLDKYDREFYEANREAIDLRNGITDNEREMLKSILGGGQNGRRDPDL